VATNTDLYRDHLMDLIHAYDKAVETFRWTAITGSFHWATDWFDVIAADNDGIALWFVEEGGSQRRETEAHESGSPIPTEYRYEDLVQ
jgi:acetyl-CoA synthetase